MEALQDIAKVSVKIDVMEFARRVQALDDTDMLSTQFDPAESSQPRGISSLSCSLNRT